MRYQHFRPFFLNLGRLVGTQHWLRLGIRYRFLRTVIQIPLHESIPFEIPFFGLRYRGNLSSHIDSYVYFYGSYERYLLLLLRDIAKRIKNPVFVDVGANVGQHTLFMAPLSAHVHSFEPYVPVRAELEKAISYNHIRNVSIHPVGLGLREQELLFYAPKGVNLGVGSFVEEKDRNRDDLVSLNKLPVVRGDEYFKDHAIERVDILKIDIEGFEKQALDGLRETIKHSRPFIVMEFSPATQASYINTESLLSSLPKGYKVYTIGGDRPFLYIFNRDGYILKPFDFGFTRGNILLAPEEKWTA